MPEALKLLNVEEQELEDLDVVFDNNLAISTGHDWVATKK